MGVLAEKRITLNKILNLSRDNWGDLPIMNKYTDQKRNLTFLKLIYVLILGQ